MFHHTKSLAAALAITTTAATAQAGVLITDFANFNLTGTYGSWTNPAPVGTDYTIVTEAFGGGFYDINPNIDASAPNLDTIELKVTLNSYETPAQPGAGLGIILGLISDAGTPQEFGTFGTTRQFGVLPGSYTFTWPVPAGLNTANLDFFHLQVDPGTNTGDEYSITFENLAIVPEPASAALLGLAGLSLIRRTR
ncbi:PEP-CTERM sorting domain-containing protein [Mucisphaera sp.]|uniref:PEP-CTERM sorting domain-containing protein n=1 Tax=Mucisphaera sp. TaxID=2913024 RepID=UPI003D0B7163